VKEGFYGLFDGEKMAMPVKASAFAGGLTLGYNHQMGPAVLGLETDVGLLAIDKTKRSGVKPYGFSIDDNIARIKQGFNLNVTGRLGLAAGDLLLYAKGGLALSRISIMAADIDGSSAPGTIDSRDLVVIRKTRAGYVVGGGLEYAFMPSLSLKVEYRYMDFGKMTATNEQGDVSTHRVEDHMVAIGINYHF
jgi:outer membrane immunogenic protein